MNDVLKATLKAAASGMNAQAHRLRVVTENIANADTHGYQRKLVSFDSVYDRIFDIDRVNVSDTYLDQAPRREIFDPSNPLADEDGYVTLSNVSVLIEMSDARQANQSYEANTTVFREARKMYANLLNILRS